MCRQTIIDMVFDRTGIDVHSIGQSAFSCAIRIRIEKSGCRDSDHYLALLENDVDEFNALVEEIIVPETWFFRDPFAYKALTRHLKSAPVSDEPFRILSLPSSSGEEAYTIAMTLLENNIDHDDFIIDAIDISQKNIDIAREGIYRKNSFRSEMSELILNKYFNFSDSAFSISEEIKKCVYFRQGNIFDIDILSQPDVYDAVFCRNMLIYFNKEKKEQAIRKLGRSLKDNGLFLTGHSETSILPTDKYTPSEIKKSFAFIKQNKPARKVNKTRKIKVQTPVETIKKPARPTTEKRIPVKKQVQQTPLKQTAISLDEAKEHADSGNLALALEMCLKILKKDASEHCYALTGTILTAMGKHEDAEKNFRKAIFLDPCHHDSLLQLAFLLERKGDHRGSNLFKRRAQKNQVESL